MKDISVKHSQKTETVDFGPIGRDVILNKKIEDETVRATNRENELEAQITEAGARVKDVKVDGVSVVTDKVANIDLTGKSNATNIENGSGSGSVQMKSDGGITTFDFTGKNPNATALDPTLTGNITYGATGQFATSFGGKNAAQGKRASSQGTTTIAKGDYSDASGINSVSLGIGATAQGLSTTAYGQGAHSEGNNTLAIGPFSHTEGRNTITYNEEAHAGGLDSIAARPYSFAHGNYVVAENIAEAVFGQYNNFTGSESYDNNRLFVVGNGQDHTHRSNAFEVYKDGSAKVGKANGSETDLTVATKGYVDAQDTAEATTRATEDTRLSDRIDSLESRGRFLSTWNATTGLPSTYPPIPAEETGLTYTYNFRAGDYYIIHNVGTSNKKPTGSSIQATRTEIGQPWSWTITSAEETESVSNNGTYTYDGTNWVLMGAGAAAAWGSIGGNIADQEDLSTALTSKVDLTSEQTISGQKSFNGTTYLGGTVYVPTSNFTTRDIKPSDTNTYSLGTPDKRFANLYLSSYLNVSGFVDSDLKPRNNDHYNLGRDDGSNVNRWKNIYVSQKLDFKAKTDTPATTASWQLDSRSNGNFVVSCNNGDAYIFRQNDFIPYGSSVNRNLGVAGNYWNDLYLKGKIDLYNSTSAQTWGLTGSQYDGIFITRSSANIYTFNTDGIFPSSNSARSLGTSDYKWKNIYFQGELNANGSAGTAGQVLTSNGANTAPTWQTPTAPVPSNMVTTDTAQFIYGTKTFNTDVNFKNSNYWIGSQPSYGFLTISSGSTGRVRINAASLASYIDNNTNLGNSDESWKNIYFKGELNANGSAGTSGQVLTSNGAGAAPTWTDAPAPSNMVTKDTEQTITGTKYMRDLHVSQTSGNIPKMYFNLPTSLTTREIGLVNDAGTIELYTDANFVPNVTNSQTLGTNTTRWSTVYTSNIANQNISIPVDSIVTKDTIQTITGGKTFNTGGITIGNTGGVSKITFTGNASWGSSGFGINGGDPNDNNRPYFELAGHFRPTTDGTKQNLGDSSHKWKDIYAAGNISDGTNSTTVANIAVKSTESTETTGQLKIAVVTALPENPDANTLYFIKEA